MSIKSCHRGFFITKDGFNPINGIFYDTMLQAWNNMMVLKQG